ncbi:mediator of DNA damage checkpoint protein 1 isoform X2 [Candoia aspera]
MEQTQLLDWDGEGDSTDGSDAAGETPKPVGRLHLLSSKYGPEKDFWIYPGQNIIGRLESCDVCLPASSVSKAHAVIEVPSSHGPHLLYDQGSLNRTRRQRVTLIPQVRYSLQDGDTLLFGDVGCQYFILVPDADCESPEDSMVVPPTQERVEASALAIEETPAPGRRTGFGQVLVQDSDKEEEEEEEEVVNGTGSHLDHTARDGSDCSNKNGTGGHVSLASLGVSLPSATVVPESDEESEDPSVSGPPCPALRLSFESQDAEPGLVENSGGHSSNREGSGEPTSKEEGVSTEHGLVEEFHLDSDTDVEDENQMGCTSEAPRSLDPAKSDRGLEVDTDTDLKESSVMAPGTSCQKYSQTAIEVGSDTDVEEEVESPAVLGVKLPSTSAENGDDDTDVEAEMENPSVVCPGRHEPVSPKEDDCKQLEDNVDIPYPQSVQLGGKKDDDTDVEALNNPESDVNALPPTGHVDVDTDVEDSSLKGETPCRAVKNCVVGVDSDGDDTDEVIKLGLESSEVACPQRTCSSSGKDSSTNMEEIPLKRIVPDDHNASERHGDVVGLTKDSNVESEMCYEVGDKSPRDLKRKEPLPNPKHQYLPTFSLDGDTDGEEEADNPDVESKKSQQVSSAESSKGSRGSHFENPDIGPQEDSTSVQDRESDTNVEVMSLCHGKSMAQDSDTGTEEVAAKPLEDQGTQLIIPVRSQVGGEQLASCALQTGASLNSCEDNEDTDGEREESYSADESNTDDELDLTLQATQCFLPTETTPPRTEKAGGITATDSSCALEDEPTQAFDFKSPFLPTRLQLGNICSSPLKDDQDSGPEDDMLEATQPFCQEPERVLEEHPQAGAGKEKGNQELLVQNQPEEGKLSEQVPQPDFSASTSQGEETTSLPGDHPLPYTVEMPSLHSSLQTAGGTPEEETQPLRSVQIPPAGGKRAWTPQEKRVEERGLVVPEDGSPSVVMLMLSEATPVGDEMEENSAFVREARNAKQGVEPAQEEPASAVSSARQQRRSLRSSASSASPTPVLKRRSLRHHGSGAVAAAGQPAAPETSRRGLRRLSDRGQQTREAAEAPKQPGEEGPRKKARNRDLTAAAAHQGRTRGSQRESRAARRVAEGAAAAASGSPGAREPAKRVRRGPAHHPGLKEQPELPRTRASKRSSSSTSTSVSTPSPKDSGKGAKPGQEPGLSTPSSGRSLRHHSTESKPIGQRASSCNHTRRSTASGSPAPKVLFTGVIDEEGERTVVELGGSLAESVFDCTHLVTDRVRRTVKFLCALARGIPIVTLDWLEKSRRNAFFLAPNSFLVWDPEQENNLQFSLSTSLQTVQLKGGLFQGYEIHVTPNVKPEPEHMKDIVKCSGGTFLPRMPRAYKDKRIVVSCPEDLSRCKPAQEAGVPITNSEFILTGILQQKVDLEAHRLNGSGSPSAASSPVAPPARTSKRRAPARMAPAPPSTAKRRR